MEVRQRLVTPWWGPSSVVPQQSGEFGSRGRLGGLLQDRDRTGCRDGGLDTFESLVRQHQLRRRGRVLLPVRSEVDAAASALTRITFPPKELAEAEAVANQALAQVIEARERIHARIRLLYRGQATP